MSRSFCVEHVQGRRTQLKIYMIFQTIGLILSLFKTLASSLSKSKYRPLLFLTSQRKEFSLKIHHVHLRRMCEIIGYFIHRFLYESIEEGWHFGLPGVLIRKCLPVALFWFLETITCIYKIGANYPPQPLLFPNCIYIFSLIRCTSLQPIMRPTTLSNYLFTNLQLALDYQLHSIELLLSQ